MGGAAVPMGSLSYFLNEEYHRPNFSMPLSSSSRIDRVYFTSRFPALRLKMQHSMRRVRALAASMAAPGSDAPTHSN